MRGRSEAPGRGIIGAVANECSDRASSAHSCGDKCCSYQTQNDNVGAAAIMMEIVALDCRHSYWVGPAYAGTGAAWFAVGTPQHCADSLQRFCVVESSVSQD